MAAPNADLGGESRPASHQQVGGGVPNKVAVTGFQVVTTLKNNVRPSCYLREGRIVWFLLFFHLLSLDRDSN